jgi:hypothetical protein
MKNPQARTLVKASLVFAAAVAVLAVGWLWIEFATLGNEVADDHITAAVGAFVIAQPWAALAIVLLATNPISFALGVLVGHIGEDAKRWVKGARVPVLLLAALPLLASGCKSLGAAADRIAQDPNRLCPPNHVMTVQGCVERPSAVAQPCPDGQVLATGGGCIPAPSPSPCATPAPTPVEPGPTPSPEAAPSPGTKPTPTPVPSPTATPRPTPDPCLARVQEVLAYQLRQGHLERDAATGLLYNEHPTKGRECHNPTTGDKVRCADGSFLSPGYGPDGGWWGVECVPAPAPTPTPTATPAPTPERQAGAYSCGGVKAERVGINVKSIPKQLKAADIAAGKRQATEAECRLDADGIEPGAICILLADASVRGPKGSAPAVPSTEAHLGWLPGCHWVVRPRWEQEAPSEDLRVDGGIRHWLDDGSTNARPSWELADYPPHHDQPFGSLFRAEFDFAATIRLRACWPPNVPAAVCSPWYEVTHR